MFGNIKIAMFIGCCECNIRIIGGWGVQSTDYALQYMNMI